VGSARRRSACASRLKPKFAMWHAHTSVNGYTSEPSPRVRESVSHPRAPTQTARTAATL
jgi:hypothetical protein